jgi:hypothetical protein
VFEIDGTWPEEDSASLIAHAVLVRPLHLAREVHAARAQSKRSAENEELNAQLMRLDWTRGFACAATHAKWNNGELPLAVNLHYVPRECGKSVRRTSCGCLVCHLGSRIACTCVSANVVSSKQKGRSSPLCASHARDWREHAILK